MQQIHKNAVFPSKRRQKLIYTMLDQEIFGRADSSSRQNEMNPKS